LKLIKLKPRTIVNETLHSRIGLLIEKKKRQLLLTKKDMG